VGQNRKFLDLVLDDTGVHMPDGVLALAQVTKAEVVRHRRRDVGTPRDGYGAEVGGALLGAAVGGPLGFVGGGLLGSAIARDEVGEASVPRTYSATLMLESPDLAYAMTVGREHVAEAEAFVDAVKKAVRLK
jgi:hypothetical protein